MRRNAKFKIGLILILLGLFIPFAVLPFAVNYEPRTTLLYNIQGMKLVWEEKSNPVFVPVAKPKDIFDRVGYKEHLVAVGGVTYTFEFPEDMKDSEVTEALEELAVKWDTYKTEAKIIEALNKELSGMERFRFIKWGKDFAVVIPYKYPLVLGLLLIFIGMLMFVLSIERSRK